MPTETVPTFPGRIIRRNQTNDEDDVLAIQSRLNEVGCGPIEETGLFDKATFNAVKLFQSRSIDSHGQPLEVDGEVGQLTWSALFGAESVPPERNAASRYLGSVLTVASGEVGTREEPPRSNRGPRVDDYLRSVDLNPEEGSFAWCVAFLYFCFNQAATQAARSNPMIQTASVLGHWRRAANRGIPLITAEAATSQPELVKPGHIFVIDTGGGFGHSGIVEAIVGGRLTTIEGNSNEDGSRDGIGVFRRSRKFSGINKGFIDYSGF